MTRAVDPHRPRVQVLGDLRVDGVLGRRGRAFDAIAALAVTWSFGIESYAMPGNLHGDQQKSVLAQLGKAVSCREDRYFSWVRWDGITCDLRDFLELAARVTRTNRGIVVLAEVRAAVALIAPIARSDISGDEALLRCRARHRRVCVDVATVAVAAGAGAGDRALAADAVGRLAQIAEAEAIALEHQLDREAGPAFDRCGNLHVVPERVWSADPFSGGAIHGRDGDLEAVEVLLNEVAADVRLPALVLGGARRVGKSRLAAEVARRVAGDGWRVVIWADGTDLETTTRQLAAELGLPIEHRSAACLELDVAEMLERLRPWLVVLDDADPGSERVAGWWQRLRGGVCVLSSEWGLPAPPEHDGAQLHPVAPLGRDGRIALLRGRGVDEGRAEALADLADGYPDLLIALAADVAADPDVSGEALGRLVYRRTRGMLDPLVERAVAFAPAGALDALREIAVLGSHPVPVQVWRSVAAAHAREPGELDDVIAPWLREGVFRLPPGWARALGPADPDVARRAAEALLTVADEGAVAAAVLLPVLREVLQRGDAHPARIGQAAFDAACRTGDRDAALALRSAARADSSPDVQLAFAELVVCRRPRLLNLVDLAALEGLAQERLVPVPRVAEVLRCAGEPRRALALPGGGADDDLRVAAWQDVGDPEALAEIERVLGAASAGAARHPGALLALGRLTDALSAARAAVAVAEADGEPEARVRARLLLARAQVAKGSVDAAATTARQAREEAEWRDGLDAPLAVDALVQQAEAHVWHAETVPLPPRDRLRKAALIIRDVVRLGSSVADVPSAWHLVVAARALGRWNPGARAEALEALDRAGALIGRERPGSLMHAVVQRHRHWLAGDDAASEAIASLPAVAGGHPEAAWRSLAIGDCLVATDLVAAHHHWRLAERQAAPHAIRPMGRGVRVREAQHPLQRGH